MQILKSFENLHFWRIWEFATSRPAESAVLMVSGRRIRVRLAEGGPGNDGGRPWRTGVPFTAFSEGFPGEVQILKCPQFENLLRFSQNLNLRKYQRLFFDADEI